MVVITFFYNISLIVRGGGGVKSIRSFKQTHNYPSNQSWGEDNYEAFFLPYTLFFGNLSKYLLESY